MKYCRNCGKELNSDIQYCPNCGASLLKKYGKAGKIYCSKEECGFEKGLKE